MSEYWLISAPGDQTCQQTWDKLNNATKAGNLSVNYKFPVPDLKVGTLDQLVGLSDDLAKLDTFIETVTKKVAHYLGDLLEDQRDKLHENLMANNSVDSYADPGGGEPPPTPTSPVCDSAFSEHHGCWPCEHRDHEEYFQPSQHSSGRSSPRWDEDDDEERHHHILSQGDLPSYLTRFQWDIAKYPVKQSLRNIADVISKQLGQIDADLKQKSAAYNSIKGTLQNLEKKQTGSLMTRNLAELLKPEHFIMNSEYLTTLVVIVNKSNFNAWNATYEKITDMVVPRSSQLIYQDNEHGLFTVTVFKKVVDEFKLHARERKFVVREYNEYNKDDLMSTKNEITKLVTDKKKQFGPLVRWLKVNFSECFCAWIHVKALRVFVESVLRYGLPVNFQAVVMVPGRKNTKRLREVLQTLYGHLDHSAPQSASAAADNAELAGLGFGSSDYYPYVFYKINLDMLDRT